MITFTKNKKLQINLRLKWRNPIHFMHNGWYVINAVFLSGGG
jgi:hypothetical protein